MKSQHKMAIVGSGMVAAGVGLGMIGAALIVPAVFGSVVKVFEKGADRLSDELEGASRKVGTVAGTLHRSFNEAARVGVAEMRRGNSGTQKAAN